MTSLLSRRTVFLAALLLALAPAPALAQTELDKLTASDPAAFDQFGYSVAVSGDLAVVGAYFDDDAGSDSGSAYVFRRTDAGWVQVAKLTASDAAAGDYFGSAVAVSGDLAVVGARFADDAGPTSGSAYLFDLASCGAACTETAKLTPSDAAPSDQFGFSVAVSGDVAVVGAFADDDGASASGSAYVFDLSSCDVACTETAKLTASDAAADDYFGWSVAVSGGVAVVGAYADDDGGGFAGSAYVFALADASVSTEPVDGGGGPPPEPVVVPAAGQTEVFYAGTIWNETAGPLAVDGWPVITMPDGSLIVRRRPTVYNLAAGEAVDYSGAFNVLAAFPPGSYLFTYALGDHPDDVWSFDEFALEKEGSVAAKAPGAGPDAALDGRMAARAVAALAARGDSDWMAVASREGLSAAVGSVPEGASASDASAAGGSLPSGFALGAAYPNPFNPTATVPFHLAKAGAVRLAVYDVLGREVARLVDGHAEAGSHTAVFEASALPSGTYLVRFEAAGQAQTQRLTLIK